MKGILKKSTEAKPYLSSVMHVHDMIENTPFLLTAKDPENGDNLLHKFIREGRFEVVSYLLSRGKDMPAIDGIEVKNLSPIDIHNPNNDGKTPDALAKELYEERKILKPNGGFTAKRFMISKITKAAIDNKFPRSSKALFKIYYDQFHEINEIPTNTDDNIDQKIIAAYLTSLQNQRAFEYSSDLEEYKTPSENRVSFKQKLTTLENTMPHYPSFDPEWKKSDTNNNRKEFIDAYKAEDFKAMEKAIIEYNIKFKASDTVSELVYAAIDHGCFQMAKELAKQGSADKEYVPKEENISLAIKFNHALREAKEQARALKNIPISIANILNNQPLLPATKKRRIDHGL